MIFAFSNDLDYLATRLHARRSRMAEAERLDDLCRIQTFTQLCHVIHPGAEFSAVQDFQRRLVQNLVYEISGCLKHLDGNARNFVEWLLVRFQLENLKVLLRGFMNHTNLAELEPHLVIVQGVMSLDAPKLMATKSLEEFIAQLPSRISCKRLSVVASDWNNISNLFLLESALDADYLEELLGKTADLPDVEREAVGSMVFQEANAFEFMLVSRGRFHFGLAPESLRQLCVFGAGRNGEWFNRLLSAQDIPTMARLGLGIVIDSMPLSKGLEDSRENADVAAIESLARKRFLRLANSAFRRSHLGIGVVAGYFGVRRVEIANLITLSEGIRLGIDDHEIRARMISRIGMESTHV